MKDLSFAFIVAFVADALFLSMQIERTNILNCVRAFTLLMLNKEINLILLIFFNF